MMRKTLIAACAAAALSVGSGIAFLSNSPVAHAEQTPPAPSAETYRLLELFGNVFDRVRRDYVEDVTDQQLIEAAINGMLTDLDPHSSYLPADGFKDMQV